MAHPSDLKRKNADYSTTSKYVDWVGNPSWREGYNELLTTGNDDTGYGKMWATLSATSEDVGADIYEKISNFVSNINDIDTNTLHGIKSYSDMIGYNANMEYLDFNFPIEIRKLLDIFSIKKDILLKSSKILTIDSRIDMFNEVKESDIYQSVMDGYNVNEFDKSTQEYIASVSGDPILYTMYSDDDKYLMYIDKCFENALLDMILLRYREFESGIIPSVDNEPYIYNQSIDTESRDSEYIWKSTIDSLRLGNLFTTPNSRDEDIINTKIQYDIPLWFPEKQHVDEINDKLISLNDFTVVEQIVLRMEFKRRKEERNLRLGVSRYFIERENKVKDYFQFMELFNQSLTVEDISDYSSVDPTKFIVDDVTDSNPLIVEQIDGTWKLSYDVIVSASKKLRNIAIKISYIRQILKMQAQRYYQTGSNLILTETINDYFNRYIYDTNTFWRYDTTDGDPIPVIQKNKKFNIDIIEYTDVTEYLNISAEGDEPADAINMLNRRYWEDDENSTGIFEDCDIVNIYKNIIGIEFDSVPDSSASGYATVLSSFLDVVYNSAAVSATSATLTSEVEETIVTDTGMYYLNGDDLVVSGDAEVCPLSDDLFKNGYADYSYTNGVPHEGWTIRSGDGGSININTDEWALELNTSVENGSVGLIHLNSDSLTEPLIKDQRYLIELDAMTYRFQESRTKTFVVHNGAEDIPIGLYCSSTDDQGIYNKRTMAFTVKDINTCTLTIVDQENDGGYETFLKSIKLYKLIDPINKTYFINTDSVQLSTVTTTNTVIIPAKSDAVYYKYIGQPSGMYPHANIKNIYHPSYQIHPYMKNFYEIIRDGNPLKNVFKYVTQGYENDYATVSDRIDEYGNLVNAWYRENVDFTGYTTSFEESDNNDKNNVPNKYIDVEHPFIYDALVDLYDNSLSAITSVSQRSGDFYDKYYKHLDLQDVELDIIHSQLYAFAGGLEPDSELNETIPLYQISKKVVYQYLKDQYGNIYTLFKDVDSADALGELWIRKKNHPISFPAFKYSAGSTNNRSIASSQIPHGKHNSLLDELDYSNGFGGIINVYDIGFSDNILYMVYNNHDDPLSQTLNEATVMFGCIEYVTIETDSTLHDVLSFRQDDYIKFERFEPTITPSPDKKIQYIGVYVRQGEFVGVFTEVSTNGKFTNTNIQTGDDYLKYSTSLIFIAYAPLNYSKQITTPIHMNYNINYNTYHNCWKVVTNYNTVSIIFESTAPPINTDLMRNLPQAYSSELGQVNYSDLMYGTGRPILYRNGFTTIDYNLDTLTTPDIGYPYDVSYFYKNSSVSYYPLYSGGHGLTNFNSPTFNDVDTYNIQFFGSAINSTGQTNDGYVYEHVLEPITELSSYQNFYNTSSGYQPTQHQTESYEDDDTVYVWEGETDPTDVTGYQYVDDIIEYTGNDYHILEDMDENGDDPIIGDEIIYNQNSGVFKLFNRYTIVVYYTILSDNTVDSFYFLSNIDNIQLDIDSTSSNLDVEFGGNTKSFNIKLINKDEAKFIVSTDIDASNKIYEQQDESMDSRKMTEILEYKITD